MAQKKSQSNEIYRVIFEENGYMNSDSFHSKESLKEFLITLAEENNVEDTESFQDDTVIIIKGGQQIFADVETKTTISINLSE